MIVQPPSNPHSVCVEGMKGNVVHFYKNYHLAK